METLGSMAVRLLRRNRKYDFNKASKKNSPKNSWVTILKLKSSSDGGILDPDDQLNYVADDREQIIAIYKEDPPSCPPRNNGNDIRAGFVDTDSPVVFSGNKVDIVQEDKESCSATDVEITAAQISSGSSVLQVRRGSEPALNCLVPLETKPISESPTTTPNTAVDNMSDDRCSKHPQCSEESLDEPEPMSFDSSTTTDEENTGFLSIGTRSSARKSLFLNSVEASRWREAAQQIIQSPNLKREESPGRPTAQTEEDDEKIISLKYEPGPLGIHVVPGHDSDGRNAGLVIQGVERGSRIDRDGRLQAGDRIVRINGQNLLHTSFQEAQEIFKNALKDQEVRIHFRTGTEPSSKSFLLSPENVFSQERSENSEEEETERDHSSASSSKGQPGSLGQKNLLLQSNTRKIGRKLDLKLTKGSDGLGFSITTRDNPARGHCPVYIKNILPKGAAVQDGRLKAGDRLLEVNGIEMTGLSQAEAAQILRNISPGGTVHLVLSRQDVDPPEKSGDSVGIYPWLHKEVLTFDIPVNDTESAGLGVSVKGRTSVNPTGPVDLGIFVKSVIHGGAAFKDGRLKPNDQLLNINGTSLLNMTNTEAMKTLRKAVIQEEGPSIIPRAIAVKIARRVSTLGVVDTAGESQGSPKSNFQNNSVIGSDVRYRFPEGNIIQNSSIQVENKGSESLGKEKGENLLKNHTNVCIPKLSSNFDENMNEKEKNQDKIVDPLTLSRNPVIDRLTGQKSQIQTNWTSLLHDESYLCRGRERLGGKLVGNTYSDLVQSPTVNMPSCSSVMIEVESSHENQLTSVKNRPGTPEHLLSAPGTKHRSKDNHDEKNNSAVSIITNHIPADDGNPFNLSRDGFGRQSVSEKRNAQLDVHNMDAFQKNKQTKEERENQKHIQNDKKDKVEMEHQAQHQQTYENHKLLHYPCCRDQVSERKLADENAELPRIRPFLGMRKSSSLESLQTVIQELRREETYTLEAKTTDDKRTKNDRLCLAADQPFEGTQEVSGSVISSGSHGCASLAAMFNFSSPSSDCILDEYLSPHRKSSKQSKKRGLWKGLGSVFKVGKNKKTQEVTKMSQEVVEGETDKTRKAKQQQQKILKQYQELVDRDRKDLAIYGSARFPSPSTPNYFLTRSPTVITGKLRERQLEQLRAEHQRKQGHYVKDEMEELYEKEIKEAIVQQPVLLYR